MSVQEKFQSKDAALKRAKELAQTKEYVVVIQSRDDYYVEFDIQLMVRSWEVVLVEYYNNKKMTSY
jgi:hypothetical protein